LEGEISAQLDGLFSGSDDDPVVPLEDRASFTQEMKEAGADWQLHVFGGVGHSFTNPDWNMMLALFDKILK
jgi:dienelactone hydrolase